MCVVEEHVAQGGVGQMVAHFLLRHTTTLDVFEHVCARGYPSGEYGSQAFHRKECGLDCESVAKRIEQMRARP